MSRWKPAICYDKKSLAQFDIYFVQPEFYLFEFSSVQLLVKEYQLVTVMGL